MYQNTTIHGWYNRTIVVSANESGYLQQFSQNPENILRTIEAISSNPSVAIDPAIVASLKHPIVHDAFDKLDPKIVGETFKKIFSGNNVKNTLQVLFDSGLDKKMFQVPEIENLHPMTMDQKSEHHAHNLLDHTLHVVDKLDVLLKQQNISGQDRANMLMAALFHDYGKAHPEIGKPKAKDPRYYSYIGHADESAKISDSIMKRLGIEQENRDFINVIVKEHMRPHTKEWTDKGIRKFINDTKQPGTGRDLWDLVMLHARADTLATNDRNADDDALKQKHIEQMRQFVNSQNSQQSSAPTSFLSSRDIQAMFPDIDPRPPQGSVGYIKFIQDRLENAQKDGKINSSEDAKKFVDGLRNEIYEKYKLKTASASHRQLFPH